jgi:hypothetical protein
MGLMNKIRNILQTVQNREVVKTAPDIVVYLEGLPYILNPYITDKNGKDSTLVSFNDHVIAFQASYDVDNLIPTANIQLSVPNQLKYLYQAPGGNNLIESMMQVQVFAKGYFTSSDGNTIYHRVFRGLTSHIGMTDTGSSLEISIQCQGVMHLLELMYIDLNPALLSNSERQATITTSNQSNLNPYEMLADTLLRGVTFEGFQFNAILQAKVKDTDFAEGVRAGYINKWQSILVDVRKDVRILGYNMGSVLPQDIDGITGKSAKVGKEDPTLKAAATNRLGKLAASDSTRDRYVHIIRGYLPDMGFGTIELTNGRITSRVERLRLITNMIGYEGYQDLDGSIIFKPPLYNLDVTNLSKISKDTSKIIDDITEKTNPFVVNLSEILTESENEDQAAIRSTRMTIQPNWLPELHFSDGTPNLRPAITHIDIPKLTKFGLREEPARTLGWLARWDKISAYTYAVSELNRANRGYRQYNFTMPLRPELKLGFPMYIPHKDMYGYIKSISMSYQVGGTATMSVLLDTIRKRPVFPTVHKTVTNVAPSSASAPPFTSEIEGVDSTPTDGGSLESETVVYTTQPNLVMQWTNPPNASSASSTAASSDGGTASDDPRVNKLGTAATQVQPDGTPVYKEQLEVIKYRRSQLGTSWATKADTTSKSFRVQKDEKGFFSSQWLAEGIDMNYYQKILTTQPYTDEKGYELVTPFPWGRWKDLKTAYLETREGSIVEQPNAQDAEVLRGVSVFLFAGVGAPNGSLDIGSDLQKALAKIQTDTSNNASFELVTPKTGGGDSSLLRDDEPDALIQNSVEQDVEQRVNMFLSGNASPSNETQAELDIAQTVTEIGLTPKS